MKYLMKSKSFTESKTYIKTFEDINPNLIYDDCRDSYMWKIPTKNQHIKIALKKIGMDQSNIDSFYNAKN